MNDIIEPVFVAVQQEKKQSIETRLDLYEKLRKHLGRPVISFMTSFNHPVSISDKDAEVLEALLQTIDLSNGLALLISSPGGQSLAAERIIRVCRTYSGTGEYWAIVPSRAKSAATMICFGAEKIIMGPTSELGPVDPQWILTEGDRKKIYPAYYVVKSYESLFNRAVRAKGNLQPFIQQLANYDERDIERLKAELNLTNDIAIEALHTGMMSKNNIEEIRELLKPFLVPEKKKTHGRPIFYQEAIECGLVVECEDVHSECWRNIYELYVRLQNFVEGPIVKCIETPNTCLTVNI